MVGEVEGANIIKLDRTRPKISYLSYPQFDEIAHPPLETSVVVWLDTMAAKLYDFSGRENPPVLHRKETFVPPEYPKRDLFARLTRQEERQGILEEPDIGTLQGWARVLSERGLKVAGHVLRRA
jgi:DNA phosphorothioation-associated putative methyltransferase